MFVHTKPRYSIKDLCALLNQGRANIYAAINRGELETHLIGARRFATPEALDKHIALTTSPEYQAAQRAKRNSDEVEAR